MICRAAPYEGQEPYIFLSYCHRDRERLIPLFDYLAGEEYRIWFDDGNQGGDDWLDNIENHLEDCRVMIAFITENSSLSHNCKSEIVYALKCRKKVIPILMGSTELPKGLRMQLSHLHYLSRMDFDSDELLMAKACKAVECQDCRISAAPEQTPAEAAPPEPPVIPDPVPETQTLTVQETTAGESIFNRLTSRLFPQRLQSEPKPRRSFRMPEFLRKKHPADPAPKLPAPQETAAAPVPQDTTQPAAAVTVPQNPAENQLYVSKKSDTPAQDVTQAANSGGNQLYVSSNSDVSAQQAAQPANAPDTSSSAAPQGSPVNQTAAQPDPDEVKTVYDHLRHSSAPSHPDESGTTILISNRTAALLFHVRAGRAYVLRKPQTKIGRSPIKCDVILEGNESISKLHAELRCYNQKFYLMDAGSTNGTYLQGQKLTSGDQVQLTSPAVFQLNDEPMILLTGDHARAITASGCAAMLVNANNSAAVPLTQEVTYLNRNNKWFDGTLNDSKVHRAAHAQVRMYRNTYYLVDESPEGGNGTSLNQYTLKHGEARPLSSGDKIQLGDTLLTFVTITL